MRLADQLRARVPLLNRLFDEWQSPGEVGIDGLPKLICGVVILV